MNQPVCETVELAPAERELVEVERQRDVNRRLAGLRRAGRSSLTATTARKREHAGRCPDRGRCESLFGEFVVFAS